MQKDPILEALARIEAKQDEALHNQQRMDAQLQEIHADCRRTAIMAGAASGGVMGGIVTTGVLLIRAKLGL
ncbi:uncharacterized protein YhaN [Neisseria sp. HSC-16F19]|nr:hypothetical protein [Neisseria sp. HSC-16F19]MCP2041460.1 uncharacterized protein YhaN [Neisseria sp. HSC-16F19]